CAACSRHQAAVGAQGAEDGARVGGDDPVDGSRSRRRLLEVGRAACGDGERLPVDGGMAGACAVLRGDRELAALLEERRRPVDGLAPGGWACPWPAKPLAMAIAS